MLEQKMSRLMVKSEKEEEMGWLYMVLGQIAAAVRERNLASSILILSYVQNIDVGIYKHPPSVSFPSLFTHFLVLSEGTKRT